MKKHSMMLLSFTALLSLNAFAPQIFWADKNVISRSPSSLEEDRLEELAIKEKELAAKTAKAEDLANQCKKEQTESLEDQMKKLLADNQKLLKEIEALKTKKEEPKVSEVAEEAKPVGKTVKAPKTPDMMSFMMQITSLMMSQQEQQMVMMNNMFSMMTLLQKPQAPEPISKYFSPYAFASERAYDTDHFSTDYSLIGRNAHKVGLGLRYENASDIRGPGLRAPSQVYEENNSFQRNYLEPREKSQYPIVHDGFNFGMNSMGSFTRGQF